jgi:hypothetical protein
MDVEQALEMMHIVEITNVTIFYTKNIYATLQRVAKYNPSTLIGVLDENP